MGGYTGWGIWLIGAVFAFNLVCLLLWFVVGGLRRGHTFHLKQGRTFLALLREQRDQARIGRAPSEEIEAAICDAEALLDKAEGLGPLWGRRALSSARVALNGIAIRFSDLADEVNRKMAG